MTDGAQDRATGRFDLYGAHYSRFGVDLAAALRREVVGEALGQTGWRTAWAGRGRRVTAPSPVAPGGIGSWAPSVRTPPLGAVLRALRRLVEGVADVGPNRGRGPERDVPLPSGRERRRGVEDRPRPGRARGREREADRPRT